MPHGLHIKRLVTSVDLIAVMLMFVFALLLGLFLVGISAIAGRVKRNPTKLSVYECGVPPSGTSRERFSVKFYLVAIFFLIFDIEIVFFFPWAIIFKNQIAFGPMILFEMLLFIAILVIGYLYIWKSGALEWD